VITYDRRGYARSGGEPPRSMSAHAADAALLLEQLQATPAVVVGTSAGAGIAVDLAVRRPDLVRAVVAHEFPWRFTRHLPPASRIAALAKIGWLTVRGRPADATEVLLRSAYTYRDGGSAWDAFPQEWRRVAAENARAALADFRNSIAAYPSASDLATVEVPVVCSYGTRSPEFMRVLVGSLAAAIPKARTREIEGAGHAAPFDATTPFVQVIAEAIASSTSVGRRLQPENVMAMGPRGRADAFREARLRRARRQAVTIARAVRAGRARVRATRAGEAMDGDALLKLVSEAAAEAQLVEVPANRRPWTATRIRVASGESVTWLASGHAYLIRPIGLGVRPSLGLLGRVQGGPAQMSPRATFTFVADRDGPIELGGRFPGELHEDGSITVDRVPYLVMRGHFSAVVARWGRATNPMAALQELARRDPSGLCAMEAARIADPPQPPEGWGHHPLLGHEDVYRTTTNGIAAKCRHSNAIIRRPVETALTPALRLRWSWRVDELPSRLPEDTMLTHDYLSVALEFDDGRDLTWQWSCALPEGFAYPCPLEHWRRRETHIVVRSGTADLGRWVDDERPILADHQAAIGGTPPARVVSAWLLAGSLFQGRIGRAEFGSIELVDGDRSIRVL
jgi:pimeloyl-ACP methyl ester carboxylesterase